MTEIKIYNDGKLVAVTSKVRSVHVVKEICRMYTLSFELLDPSKKKYIKKGAVFEVDGQMFDICGYDKSYGNDFVTSVSAQHIGYRLNNYLLPEGYSFIGTIAEIADDILINATNKDADNAYTEFSLGAVVSDTKKYTLDLSEESGQQTARAALFELKNLGAEFECDNFTINLPKTTGTGNNPEFKVGKNLKLISESWDIDNGSTYTLEGAVLHRVPNSEEAEFDAGDYATVYTDDETIRKRIISYDRCLDNPIEDRITLGVFVRDTSSQIVEIETDLEDTVKQNTEYNNVKINHKDGFVACTEPDGDGKIISAKMNATHGFGIFYGKGDDYDKQIFEVDSSDGTIRINSIDGKYTVEMGTENGFAIYKNGVMVDSLDENGNIIVEKIMSKQNSNYYGRIGQNANGNYGLTLYDALSMFCGIFGSSTTGDCIIQNKNNGAQIQFNGSEIDLVMSGLYLDNKSSSGSVKLSVDTSGHLKINDTTTYSGDVSYGNITLKIRNGLVVGV